MMQMIANSQEVSQFLAGKKVLITGGTGSFGNQILKSLLEFNPEQIVIYSRDEKKQYDMGDQYVGEPRLHFIIGDVRDYDRLAEALRGIDIVFHAAALKQVPNCEKFPIEAVRTNVIGAENLRRAAIANGVDIVVVLSTDKAVKPVNVMGMTKALGEKIILNPTYNNAETRFTCVRYGNVLGSRGSVVPLFRQRIQEGRPLPVTDPKMTRFLLTLPQAIDLVFHAMIHGKDGNLYVRKMSACTIGMLAQVMSRAITGRNDYPIDCIGVRPGEKIHEVLVSEEEMARAIEAEHYYELFQAGKLERHELIRHVKEYTSENTERLNSEELKILLESGGWV